MASGRLLEDATPLLLAVVIFTLPRCHTKFFWFHSYFSFAKLAQARCCKVKPPVWTKFFKKSGLPPVSDFYRCAEKLGHKTLHFPRFSLLLSFCT